jgi:hypothetical protein
MNEKHGWRLLAYDALRDKYGWPVLSQRARQVLERAFAEAAADSERRRNPEVRKAANRQRLARHHNLDEATGADLPAYGDGEDQEIEMTIPVAPPDHGKNLNIFGFKNPGYQCHLCALLSCLLSIGPLASAVCDVVNPAALCRALKSVLTRSSRRQGPVALSAVVEALSDQFEDAAAAANFFLNVQDPAETQQLLFDGLISQDHRFAQLLGVAMGLEDGTNMFIEAARLFRSTHLQDLYAGHVYGRMGSGAVTGWPTVLTLSVQLPDIAIAGGVVKLPRRLQWKASDGRDLWYTLAALQQVHTQIDRGEIFLSLTPSLHA